MNRNLHGDVIGNGNVIDFFMEMLVNLFRGRTIGSASGRVKWKCERKCDRNCQ